jgi:hypothetical protein
VKSYERAITGSWIGFVQSTNPEDIVDTLCDIMPFVSDSKGLFASASNFLPSMGVQFILGTPNLASTDLLQLPEHEAVVELGLAGTYLGIIPCSDGTVGMYVRSRARRSFPPF